MPPDSCARSAREHFERGEVLYVQGDYKGAVKELVAAYCIVAVLLRSSRTSVRRTSASSTTRARSPTSSATCWRCRRMRSRADACATDPQDDRANVIARINVLENLPAKILRQHRAAPTRTSRCRTTRGIEARGTSGEELEVARRPLHSCTIERDGYHTRARRRSSPRSASRTRSSTKLEPRQGQLRVRVVPARCALVPRQAPGRHRRVRDRAAGRALHAVGRGAGSAHRRARDRGRSPTRHARLVRAAAAAAVRSAPADRATRRSRRRRRVALLAGASNNRASRSPAVVGAGVGAGFVGTYFGARATCRSAPAR